MEDRAPTDRVERLTWNLASLENPKNKRYSGFGNRSLIYSCGVRTLGELVNARWHWF